MTASDRADSSINSTDAATPPANAAGAASEPSSRTTEVSPGKGAEEAASAGETELQEQLAKARKEAADNYEKFVRTMADLENFRRRTVREKDELRQFAASRVLEDLLPVLDNLALGLTAAKAPNAELKSLVGGIGMVQEQLKSTLGTHGLKEINPLGQPFDPNLHQSIASQASADVAEGSVVVVVRTGYALNGRLLRPASVIVSSGPAPAETKA